MKPFIKILLISIFLVNGFIYALSNIVNDISISIDDFPKSLKISEPIPNPVENYTTVKYNIPNSNLKTEISIYNLTGVKIKTIEIFENKGEVIFDTSDLQSGIYFICLIHEGRNVDSKKIIKK